MADETSKILYGPWSTYIDPPILLEDFIKQSQQHLKDLSIARDSLSYVSKLFRAGRDIWPDQCERALALIHEVNRPVQKAYLLLEIPSQLPEAVIPLRYPLAVVLCHLDDQISELMQLITLYSSACQPPSEHSMNQREEISHQFEPLMQSYDEALQKLYVILDQVYFQERKQARF
jgi:hypothetical protein